MPRILRSKPMLILGGGALARRMMNRAQMRRKRKRTGQKVTGLVLASALGGVIRYFTDSVSGSRRRQKVVRLMGKGEQSPEWTPAGGDSDSLAEAGAQDSPSSQT